MNVAGVCGDWCVKCPNFPRECRGCDESKVETCKMLRCARSTDVEHCGLCADFPCKTLEDFVPDDRLPAAFHIESLRLRSAIGTPRWLEKVNKEWGHLVVKQDERACLVVVDVQNDFCPGGALAVPGGDQVVPVLNRWAREFAGAGLPVAYTLDWHPSAHRSFLAHGGTWPAHCIQYTPGAAFHPGLDTLGLDERGCSSQDTAVFKKGFLPGREAYSGFDGRLDGDPDRPSLGEWLASKGVTGIYVGGLATDYCVRATALDGLKRGFRVTVMKDGVRAVDVRPGDGQRALEEMVRSGAEIA